VVQLRDKDLADDDLVAAAEPFRLICAEYGALFVLNDRPDLADRCGADGVHVGQSDGSVAEARRAVGRDRLVGLSVSTAAELEAADPDADYLGVGAVYGTPTKSESQPGGLELVRLARDTVRLPWFAIGGVELDTVEEIAIAGAPGVAVVRAIRDADDPEAAARALRKPLPPAHAVVAGREERDRGLLPQIELAVVAIAPGEGVGPHTHRVHADVFYVLDGELDLRLGDGTVRVPPGSCVTAPPHLVHGFRNRTDDEVRYLNLHAPGVWARGHAAGADPATFDVFGIEGAPPDLRGDISGPGDGDRLMKEHRLLLVKSSQPELDVVEFLVGAEYAGTDPHVHLRHADCFYVLEGELDVLAGDETVRVGPGGSVVVPPGVAHAFTSVGSARFVNVHAPSCGFVEYVRRVDAGEQVDPAHYDMYDVTLPAG
jgi:thiamine-phosphate pyrophosphorylase